MTDPALSVIGVGCIVVGGCVAAVAVGSYALITGGVATDAGYCAMGADERERSRVLIGRVRPGAGGGMVARFTVGSKAGQQVVWVS